MDHKKLTVGHALEVLKALEDSNIKLVEDAPDAATPPVLVEPRTVNANDVRPPKRDYVRQDYKMRIRRYSPALRGIDAAKYCKDCKTARISHKRTRCLACATKDLLDPRINIGEQL